MIAFLAIYCQVYRVKHLLYFTLHRERESEEREKEIKIERKRRGAIFFSHSLLLQILYPSLFSPSLCATAISISIFNICERNVELESCRWAYLRVNSSYDIKLLLAEDMVFNRCYLHMWLLITTHWVVYLNLLPDLSGWLVCGISI